MTESAQPQHQPLPVEGWYPDGNGRLRWWDGQTWGPVAPSQGPSRTWAILAHVTMFVLPVLAAIALRVTVGRSGDRFTRHHTNEAMNAQLWLVIVWNLAAVPLIFIGEAEEPPGWAFAVSFPLFAAIWVSALVLCIRAALRASNGDYYRYPLPFRFTKGTVREAAA